MAETPREDREKQRDGPAARILVVDDEEIVHVSLKRILGRYGHRVNAVFGAAEALPAGAADLDSVEPARSHMTLRPPLGGVYHVKSRTLPPR